MNKLWVRLLLAFTLVSALVIAVTAWLSNTQVSRQFQRFVLHDEMLTSTLPTALLTHYANNQSWEGVETVFVAEFTQSSGQGRGQGRLRTRYVLADTSGQVYFDGTPASPDAPMTTDRLSASLLADAFPLRLNRQVVGYLLIQSPGQSQLSESATAFLAELNRTLLQTGALAAGLGLLLSLFIARSIAAPLRQLATASRQLAGGEFQQHVRVRGSEEMHELATAFNDMADSLEKAEALRRNMVADIAHELRTPLTVIQGNLQAILDGVYPLERQEIEAIYDESLILTRLVSDLRELAQAEAGQLSLNRQDNDLAALALNTLEQFRETARQKQIDLQHQLTPDLPPVSADADRIRQVLHNLLSNALRHTPTGGQVRLEVVHETGGYLRTRIIDTGPGIDPTEQAHVFDRFWRAEKSRARMHGGTGLGLAITRQLIVAHKGRIGVESTPGQGSCFWFDLPLSKQA